VVPSLLTFALSLRTAAACPDLSPEESDRLAAREVVVCADEVEGAPHTIAFVDVWAHPDAVLDAVLDLEPRAEEVGPIASVDVYLRTPERLGARISLSVLGVETIFHVLYSIDRPSHRTSFSLDTSQENDIASSAGTYAVETVSPGRSRLTFTTLVDGGSGVPEWLHTRVTRGPLLEQLEGIRSRAEGH
jgi:hypothetical protein